MIKIEKVIEPRLGVVLVELTTSEWGDIPVVEKSHDSMSWGKIVKVHPDDNINDWVGKNGHWRLYKDDAKIGKDQAFIEIKDILGISYDSNYVPTNKETNKEDK